MNDAIQTPSLPDRLSADPRSPYHVAAFFERDVGIRFNGKERTDVEEYCISETNAVTRPKASALIRVRTMAIMPGIGKLAMFT